MFDGDYSYRCENCMAVVGSIGQPKECKEAAQKYDVLRELGSRAYWDYKTGEEKMR
jgi:predicted nucleic acid-binding Zn ribbon protein